MVVARAKAGIERIKPHMIGGASEAVSPASVLLNSNESVFGPSPIALDAARAAVTGLERYLENPDAILAPAIANHFGLDAARITTGQGSDDLLARLAGTGIRSARLTLHVGAGTFLPVKADDTDDHQMHSEFGRIEADTAERLNAAREAGGRIIAVGTTSLRLLESSAREDGTIEPFAGDTDIFITPGYKFRAVDGLMTNFHLPKSTLMMLVSALIGRERMMAAYEHAIANNYRFYSYGDSSLLLP